FTARSKPVETTSPEQEERNLAPQEPVPTIKPPESYKPAEESRFLDNPPFLQPKPIPHSPKISPSSIPNPNPSVTTTKQVEPGYPNYGGYIYSIPGYSAFQPVSYPGVVQPSQAALPHPEPSNSEFVPFAVIPNNNSIPTTNQEEKTNESKAVDTQPLTVEKPKPQTDFEANFSPTVIPVTSMAEVKKDQINDSKMSITSIVQGSGATVTIPTQHKEVKKKTNERFSLKTSIPISKIDMKCVTNPPEAFQTSLKKPMFNPTFPTKNDNASKVEIQSNIVIKSAPISEFKKDTEIKDTKAVSSPASNNISTLINAAEMINKSETQFQQAVDNSSQQNLTQESRELSYMSQMPPTPRPLYNPNVETNKPCFNKQPEGVINDQKNQILFIQNKNPSNSKMLVTIQQQNSQVLVQRTSFDSKNLQAPSRLSGQGKKCKEEILNDNLSSSKVVALKRMHQENCDENDFENLITENQIYGNKIVVKEKCQGTLQEQDLKSKKIIEKPPQTDTKNVVLQPNFLYLSNVQFPANVMMIKNNKPVNDNNKVVKISSNENKPNEVPTTSITDPSNKITKPQNVTLNKEVHVLKSTSNNVSVSNKSTDVVFQAPNQKVIMNPQIVYQVPMIVETDKKNTQTFVNDYTKPVTQNVSEFQKPFEQSKTNDKLYIACPYQMDSKLQPKIVITNIRTKVSKTDEISSLDVYEKKKRIRRMKYLSNRDGKDIQKLEKKNLDNLKNIITPDKMKAEIYKEFTNTRIKVIDDSTDEESDYDEDELKEYNSIINDNESTKDANESNKIDFLAGLNLATQIVFKEKELERMERILKRDSIAAAYIAAGRLDKIFNDDKQPSAVKTTSSPTISIRQGEVKPNDNEQVRHRKQLFLSQLSLMQVTTKYKESYEKVWREIVRERKRRNGTLETDQILKQPKLQTEPIDLDPNDQLQMLTEIKKHVNENNNLIKKKLDSSSEDGDSIRTLAEKNFSELNRLSKMADRSVKHFSGQDTRKRDLNPGFDSENIQKTAFQVEQPFHNYPNLNIPNISNIISLKSTLNPTNITSSQATSMDEPQNSAAGVREMFNENTDRVQDFSCQVDEIKSWPGIDAIISNYREFEIGRKKEIDSLYKRNTALRVEAAHITRSASRDAERARSLLAERHNLASEEARVSHTLHRLYSIIELVKKC
ncbi:uncharacterized protein LOC106708195, partial [Papilio machaon]|uniref:uncharacterized protein LOC106708195 n=1 Tax=Papilio machaon TaxID=76193 RepID=UPI001E6644C5